MKTAREQAIEYRRQLLRIVDQIERDYCLGKYAPTPPGFPLVGIPEKSARLAEFLDIDTQPKK